MEKDLENRIRGAMYGFAIGDALGATTEFMTQETIQRTYGKVEDYLGGGWLNTIPGEGTDDTQMTLCVAKALMDSIEKGVACQNAIIFRKMIKKNFIEWYDSNPKDIGQQCKKGIEALKHGTEIKTDVSAVGNGSLMRALPCALLDLHSFNVMQGELTHNNRACTMMITRYHDIIVKLIHGEKNVIPKAELCEPTGYVLNTFNNACYWADKDNFTDCVVGAVNHGGDADTIAAIAGSISGAKLGYSAIPQKYITGLNVDTKKQIEKFVEFVCDFYS